MPANLKSLFSRSRSRNELKPRPEEAEGEASASTTHENSNGGKDCGSGCSGMTGTLPTDQFLNCDISPRTAAGRNGGSCSHLMPSHSEWTSHSSPGTRAENDFLGIRNLQSSAMQEQAPLAMRKCETVLTLSTFTGNSTVHGFPGVGPKSDSEFGRGKVMRNKILSTSSSTINSILHSSARAKLFSSWKFSSGSNSGPSSPSSFCASSSNETADVPQIYKSQLSIPDNGMGSVPMTPLNRLRRNVSINNAFYSSSYSRSCSVASFPWKDDDVEGEILCRLCLCSVKKEDTVEIAACSCLYCTECITAYVNFEIREGAEEIACPDATCEKQGVLSLSEIELLVTPSVMEKHNKFRLYREVEKDAQLVWCPTPGCETIVRIEEYNLEPRVDEKAHKSRGVCANKSRTISCITCRNSYCAECKLTSHPGISCEGFRRKMIKQGKLSVDDEELFALDCIKKCPFCHVPIEKDSGCAQMMCKKCKHVFCWYCLSSLDDDFLLRHYDKGPCKNKLGHSRASVVWHRAQVIGIFAGFGVLILLASPLLILAAPCLLCCRCRYCAKDSEDSPVHV